MLSDIVNNGRQTMPKTAGAVGRKRIACRGESES